MMHYRLCWYGSSLTACHQCTSVYVTELFYNLNSVFSIEVPKLHCLETKSNLNTPIGLDQLPPKNFGSFSKVFMRNALKWSKLKGLLLHRKPHLTFKKGWSHLLKSFTSGPRPTYEPPGSTPYSGTYCSPKSKWAATYRGPIKIRGFKKLQGHCASEQRMVFRDLSRVSFWTSRKCEGSSREGLRWAV